MILGASRSRRLIEDSSPRLRELKFTAERLRRSPLSIIGVTIIIFFGMMALLAPIIAPTPAESRDPYIIPRDNFSSTPRPPSAIHPFGTTEGQYDIYYGVIWGTRVAFYVGLTVVGISMVIGIVLGAISGYYGGVVDEALMRFTDVIFAFPALILAMALVAALGPTLGPTLGLETLRPVILAITVTQWPLYARVIRGEVFSTKQEGYVEAAKALGSSDLRLILKHILPNSISPLFVIASLDVGAVVLTEAVLSFLGLGPPIGFADWGQMVSFSRGRIIGGTGAPFLYWYTYTIPGLFIFFFVLGWNLLGDAFRDILDPTARRS